MRRGISYTTCFCVQFAVHLGVARGYSVVSLEQTARNSGYRDVEWGGGSVLIVTAVCVCVGGRETVSRQHEGGRQRVQTRRDGCYLFKRAAGR